MGHAERNVLIPLNISELFHMKNLIGGYGYPDFGAVIRGTMLKIRCIARNEPLPSSCKRADYNICVRVALRSYCTSSLTMGTNG